MISLRLFPLVLATALLTAQAHGETSENTNTPENIIWHGRAGIGLNPVASRTDYLPRANMGFGISLSGFVQLPYRFSVGVGVDWEKYTFDSNNFGDPLRSVPRYTAEPLTHTRLMMLAQWDVLTRGTITPFVLAGAGYGGEDAELTTWQCSPKLMSGPVLGVGAGVEVAVHEAVGVGLEYRGNTLPIGTASCTLASIPDEPKGAPADFFSQRIGITLSVRN